MSKISPLRLYSPWLKTWDTFLYPDLDNIFTRLFKSYSCPIVKFILVILKSMGSGKSNLLAATLVTRIPDFWSSIKKFRESNLENIFSCDAKTNSAIGGSSAKKV